jgi:hypothetical protein
VGGDEGVQGGLDGGDCGGGVGRFTQGGSRTWCGRCGGWWWLGLSGTPGR